MWPRVLQEGGIRRRWQHQAGGLTWPTSIRSQPRIQRLLYHSSMQPPSVRFKKALVSCKVLPFQDWPMRSQRNWINRKNIPRLTHGSPISSNRQSIWMWISTWISRWISLKSSVNPHDYPTIPPSPGGRWAPWALPRPCSTWTKPSRPWQRKPKTRRPMWSCWNASLRPATGGWEMMDEMDEMEGIN